MHCEAAFASGIILMGVLYQIRALILRWRIEKLFKEFDKFDNAIERYEYERVKGQWQSQQNT